MEHLEHCQRTRYNPHSLALNRVPTLFVSRGTLWNIVEHFQRTATAVRWKLIRGYLINKETDMKFLKLYKDASGAWLYKPRTTLRDAFAQHLLAEIQQLDFVQEFGRGTAWLGDTGLDYYYSGRSHIATGYTPRIEILTKCLNKLTGENYNHVLVNQYKPGQKLNKHKDDEKELKGSISSLSLGAPAVFDYTVDKVTLHDRDLIIGNRIFFNRFAHGVSAPLENRTRYNITWRTIQTNGG